MSSINNNGTPGGLPMAPGAGAAEGGQAPQPGKTDKAAKAALGLNELSTDPTFVSNPSLLGEARRTGRAALATPPPLPPHAPVLTGATLEQYQALQNDYQSGLERGAPTNQPSIQALGRQYLAIDQTTKDGQLSAAKTQAKLTKTTLNMLGSTSSGDTLGAFLLATVGNQNKQRDAENTLLSLTSQGQQTMMQEQRAQHAKQAEQMKKAAEKQQKFAFLKPLLAIFTVLLSVFTAGSPLMLALTLVGSMAGFLAGGIISGKKKGTGFDFTGALEGASMGALAGGVGAILKAAFTGIEKAVGATVDKVSAGMKDHSQKILDSAIERSAKSPSTLTASALEKAELARVKAAEESLAESTGKLAKHNLDKEKSSASSIKDQAEGAETRSEVGTGAQTAQASRAKALLKKVLSDEKFIKDDGKAARLQTLLPNVGQAVGDAAQSTLDFSVDRATAKGKLYEAEAKVSQTFLDQYKSLYERSMDSAQQLISQRKASSDQVVDMLRSHYEASKNLISGFGRG